MSIPKEVPCVCLNPKCGYRFFAPSIFSGGGKNIRIINSGTNCPKCNSAAKFANHGTDSLGNPYVNLNSLFSFIRKIDNVEKLKKIKAELELNKEKFQADKLANKLTKIDPEFSKFSRLIKSIKPQIAVSFLLLMINIMTFTINRYERKSYLKQLEQSNKNEENKIELLEKLVKTNQEQLEYQKNKDINHEKEKIKENEERIFQLEKEIEKILNEPQNNNSKDKKISLNVVKNKDQSINLNEPCSCGSGKKTEVCHPFGRIFRH